MRRINFVIINVIFFILDIIVVVMIIMASLSLAQVWPFGCESRWPKIWLISDGNLTAWGKSGEFKQYDSTEPNQGVCNTSSDCCDNINCVKFSKHPVEGYYGRCEKKGFMCITDNKGIRTCTEVYEGAKDCEPNCPKWNKGLPEGGWSTFKECEDNCEIGTIDMGDKNSCIYKCNVDIEEVCRKDGNLDTYDKCRKCISTTTESREEIERRWKEKGLKCRRDHDIDDYRCRVHLVNDLKKTQKDMDKLTDCAKKIWKKHGLKESDIEGVDLQSGVGEMTSCLTGKCSASGAPKGADKLLPEWTSWLNKTFNKVEGATTLPSWLGGSAPGQPDFGCATFQDCIDCLNNKSPFGTGAEQDLQGMGCSTEKIDKRIMCQMIPKSQAATRAAC